MIQCSTLGVYPKKIFMRVHKGSCMRMFSKSFFVVVGCWKQSGWDQVLDNSKLEFFPKPSHRRNYPSFLAKTVRQEDIYIQLFIIIHLCLFGDLLHGKFIVSDNTDLRERRRKLGQENTGIFVLEKGKG